MTFLRSLLIDTRDGEWGKGEIAPGRTAMRVVRGTDFGAVREGRVDEVPCRFLEDRQAARRRLQAWDIILETAGGSPDRPTGRSLLMTPRTMELLGSQVTCASFARFLRVDRAKADPAFIFWLLQNLYNTRAIAQFNTQHTGVARFQFTTFCDTFALYLPHISAQRRIAEILGAYDDLIEVNRRRMTLLEDMARGLFEEWFVRFRFPGHEAVAIVETANYLIPEGWGRVKVGTMLRKFRRAEKVKKQDYDPTGTIPCVDQGSDFIGGYTHNSNALIDNPLPLCVFGDHTRILKFITFPFASGADGTQLLYPTDGLTSEYLYFALARIDLSNQHYARHFKFLKEEIITLPPFDLVTRFTGLAKPLMKKVQNFRSQNRLLAASRDVLLPRLISGQLSVAATERELLKAA